MMNQTVLVGRIVKDPEVKEVVVPKDIQLLEEIRDLLKEK